MPDGAPRLTPGARFPINPITIGGGILSIALWAYSYLVKSTGLDVSILVGIQPLLATLLLNLYREIRMAKEEMTGAAELLIKFQDCRTVSNELRTIINASTDEKFHGIPFKCLSQRVDLLYKDFASSVQRLATKSLKVSSSEWFNLDYQMLREANTEALCVSHADDAHIWKSPVGLRYWQLNKEKIGTGLRCTRVFILSEEELRNSSRRQTITETMKQQSAGGVQVLVAYQTSLPDELRKDMAIFDQKVYSETIMSGAGQTIGTYLDWNPERLNREMENYRLLENHSIPMDTFLSTQQ